jgi:hypothetical protein
MPRAAPARAVVLAGLIGAAGLVARIGTLAIQVLMGLDDSSSRKWMKCARPDQELESQEEPEACSHLDSHIDDHIGHQCT